MNNRMKITLFVVAVGWLFLFFKGNFLHNEAGADQVALLSKVKIFRNIRFSIVHKEKLPNGFCRMRVECTYRGKPAGMEIQVVPPDTSKQAVVFFRSLGAESDNLVKMLNDYYLTKLAPKAMVKEVRFDLEVLEGDSQKPDHPPFKVELIYPAVNDGRYARFDIDIDWNRDQVYLDEKSTDYRKPILLALRGE
jgi:hypothetical protein